jgi:hypothetical protein
MLGFRFACVFLYKMLDLYEEFEQLTWQFAEMRSAQFTSSSQVLE